MTKFYLKILTVLVLLFTSITSNAQVAPVAICCVDDDMLITCGETVTLFGDGYVTSSFTEDFNSWPNPTTPNPAVWASITSGGTINSLCTTAPIPFANCTGGGIIPAGGYLWFPHGSQTPRIATTIGVDVSTGGDLVFEFKMEAQSAQSNGCDGPDQANERITVEYSINNGATWITMPANFFPFSVNPAPFNNLAVFHPSNANLLTVATQWAQYIIPIPAAAQTANTMFRWSQMSASGCPGACNFDFWGLENLNIATTPIGGGGTYSWTDLSTGIVTAGQTITVSPTALTNYQFEFDPGGSTAPCVSQVEIDVAPPIVDPAIIVNPLSPCPTSTDLEANVSFNTCNYDIWLYDNGGDGWITNPPTPGSIDNRLEVWIDGILVNTITMNAPGIGLNPYGPGPNGMGTDQYGPMVYSFSVSAAATFETRFQSGGPMPTECAYFITDNQGQLIIDPTSALPYPNNAISAMGLNSSPNTPIWPIPVGSLPTPVFGVQPLDFGPMTPSCPTTNLYSYSWEIATGPAPGGVGTGSTVGITPPNTQTTNVVTASPQDYMVTITDLTNAGCTANGIINVPGVMALAAFETPNPSPACELDCIDLVFSNLLPYPNGGPYIITVEMIDANGPSSTTFTINGSGSIVGTGGPITLCPTTSPSSTSVTFNITSFIDNADPNSCEIPIQNPSQTITFSTQPDAGTLLDINPAWNPPNLPAEAERTFCSGDPTIDFATFFSIPPNDANGEWTYISAGPAPSMPYTGLNYMFDPSADPPGVYRYTVSNSPCSDDYVTLEIILDPGPIAGSLPPAPVDMCIGNVLNLNNEFLPPPAVPPTPYTPVWTNVTSGLPGFPVSNNFFPPSSGPYKFRSTITDPTSSCPEVWAEVDILVHDLPTVSFSTVNQICLGEDLNLNFVLTGVAPFTITISDNVNPPFNVVVDANGNDNLTGNPITYTPASALTYNLTVTNISDNFCSTTISGENSVVNVLTPPSSGGPQTFLSVCLDDPNTYDLSTQLDGTQDGTGYWIDAGGFQQASSPSFNFDTSMPGGDYIYVVTSPICITAQTIVTVAVISAPITGSANPQDICINDYPPGSPYNLDNLLSGSYDPGTWYESGVPIPTNIDPNTYGPGTTNFTYEVNGIPPCANKSVSVDLTINPEPVVASFTPSAPSTTQGVAIGLDVTMSAGTPPFTIDLYDDDSPVNTGSIFTALGMSGSINMMPNVLPTTTYAISLITDGNGCTTSLAPTVPVDVEPYPIINPFIAVTPEVCEGLPATIEFTLTQGNPPVTVEYSINGGTTRSALIPPLLPGEILPKTIQVIIPSADLSFGLNTFNISSIIDNAGVQTGVPLPTDIYVSYNQNPSATFSTTALVTGICYEDDAILEFAFSAGTPPFTVRYSDNGIELLPALIFNNLGNQTTTLSPDPAVGNHSYDIIDIVDANSCNVTIPNTENILVHELPDLDIIISGKNPICFTDFSELSFPVLSGLAPFSLTLLEGSDTTRNIDASSTYQIPNPGQYTTTYTLYSVTDANTCKNSLSNSKTLIVNEIPVVDISGTTEICKGDYTNINFDFSAGKSPWTLSYNINGIAGTPFDLDSTYDSMVASPTTTSTYTYTAIEDDNGCKDNLTDAATITVNPLPEMEVTGGGEVCDDGSTVDVIFNTSNGTPTFDFQYTVGLNTEYVSEVGYQHIISTNESGTYRVTNITDNKGCIGKSITGSADVIINPMPVADFSVYPQPADVTNPVIHFIDNSTGHIAGTWDFDDNFTANTNFGKLSHRFSDLDSGTYYVELYVESNKGCWDTQLQKVVIDNAFIFYIPNSFSPNNDMLNDIFMPYIDGVDKYDLYIYSRQGQEVFHTTDVNEGWDGYVADGDNYAIAGKYTYAIYIIDLHGKERNYQGNLSLFR